MALPDYFKRVKGSDVTWLASGGSKVLTLTSLANNAAREGDKSASLIDGTYGFPDFVVWRLESAVGSAATNGLPLELWFGESDSATAGTNNPGNLTGADAGLSNPDELKIQCFFGGMLAFSNARGTNVQKQRGVYYPTNEYVIPLLVNRTGQTLSGTAGNHGLTLTPWYYTIAD